MLLVHALRREFSTAFAELSERQLVLARGNIDFAQEPNTGNQTFVPIEFDPFTKPLLGFVELSRVVIHPPEKHPIDCRKGSRSTACRQWPLRVAQRRSEANRANNAQGPYGGLVQWRD
jgi:hypothetical protein